MCRGADGIIGARLVDQLDKCLGRLRERGGLGFFLGRNEEFANPDIVDGGFGERFGDDGGLGEFDAEAKVDYWVEEACRSLQSASQNTDGQRQETRYTGEHANE